jgi:hypothetical protein
LASPVWADTYTERLEVQCDKYQFKIREFDLSNGQPSQIQSVATTTYYDHDLHKVIEAEFQLFKSSGKGEGGGSYGGFVTLKIDDQVIVKDTPHHSCWKGTREIGVSPEAGGAYSFRVCGHTSPREMPAFDRCVTVKSDQLEKIQKPLDKFFPVGALLKLGRAETLRNEPRDPRYAGVGWVSARGRFA